MQKSKVRKMIDTTNIKTVINITDGKSSGQIKKPLNLFYIYNIYPFRRFQLIGNSQRRFLK